MVGLLLAMKNISAIVVGADRVVKKKIQLKNTNLFLMFAIFNFVLIFWYFQVASGDTGFKLKIASF
jgi:hypothetical protein